MPTIYEKIVTQFLVELAKEPEVDEHKLEKLKGLLAGKKKLKPEDLVAVFSLPQGGEIK